MSESKATVLVGGGTGFIGKVLLRRLVAAGYRTTALVFADRGQRARLPQLDGMAVIEAASPQAIDLDATLDGPTPEVVINLAAGGVRPEDRGSAALADGNRELLSRMLEAFSTSPPRLFIHAGSWSEYAPAEAGAPITEDHPLQGGSGYGGAKAEAEQSGRALAADRGIPFVTLRLFHVYGPGEPGHRLMPYLIERLADGRSVELTPGDQVRDFLFVDDAADAFLAAAHAQTLGTGDAYNVCTGEPVTVRHVVEAVADAMAAPRALLRFGALPHRADESPWMVGCNERFTTAAGWRPRVSLEDGIRRILDTVFEEAKTHHG